MFNFRLASSTPDPEKHQADMSVSDPPGASESMQHDVPVRDVSTVSSVPPSFNHLQNMAEMVDIYKQIEINKVAQLQEAAAKEAIEKLNAMEINKAALDKGQTQQGQSHQKSNDNTGTESFEHTPMRESDGFVATGSLGFNLQHSESAFRPVAPMTYELYSGIEENGQDSSLMAFQPYISTGSNDPIQPPPNWIKDFPDGSNYTQVQGHSPGQGQSRFDATNTDMPVTGRADRSNGTEYVQFGRSGDKDTGPRSHVVVDGNVMYERQDGLFQVHSKPNDHQSTYVSSENKSYKTDSTVIKGQSSLYEVPERDIPVIETLKVGSNKSQTQGSSSQDETPRLEQKNESQNLSGLTTSTPRGENTSNCTAGGKIVYIPNDNNTPNVIGFVPGIPLVNNAGQPMGWQVTKDMAEMSAQTGSVISSVIGQQGVSVSQLTAQSGGQQSSQDGAWSGYYSTSHAHAVAAGHIGVRKLRYLLKELKECNKVTSKKIHEFIKLYYLKVRKCYDHQSVLSINFNIYIYTTLRGKLDFECQFLTTQKRLDLRYHFF